MRKRGLSTVVTTLILILLVLVAIGIIWVVIENVITDNSEKISLGKFTTDLDIENAYAQGNDMHVKIKRNPGEGDLVGIKFIFQGTTGSEYFEEDTTLKELEEQNFVFSLTNLAASTVEKVSIAPIFKLKSGKKFIGDIVKTYKTGVSVEPVCGDDLCNGNEVCGDTDISPQCISDCGVCAPIACTLASGSWSATSVVDGTAVNLNVIGTNCGTTLLNYKIYEDEFTGDDLIYEFDTTSLSQTWSAQWIDDGFGQGDPEYYFVVTVINNPSEQITSSNQLSVTPSIVTPVCGDNLCNGNEVCGDTDISPQCISDCGVCTPTCGDNLCNGNEVCGDTDISPQCISDCGVCTPIACTLASGSWSATSVVENTAVNLNVAGTNCGTTLLNYKIYENDWGGGDDLIYEFDTTSLNSIWLAQYMDDGFGQGDPEYYFVVTVVNNPGEQITSSNELSVSQIFTQSIVTRQFSSTTVIPGGTIDVTLSVVIVNGETYYAVEENIPTGWAITNNGGGGVLTDTLKWAVIENAVDISYTYTLQAPASTGNYVFIGTHMFEGFTSPINTLGVTTVSVQ